MNRRFWAKVERGEGDCWLWTAAKDRKGYGKFAHEGKLRMAHRVSYAWFVGPVSSGLQLDHLCRVRNCVNPSHLEAVTAHENNRRSDSPSAKNIGKTHCSKGHELTPENTITQIRNGRPSRKCRLCTQEFDRLRWPGGRKSRCGASLKGTE